MPRGVPKDKPKDEDPTPDGSDCQQIVVQDGEEHSFEFSEPDPAREPVSRAEHDAAVNSLRNEISYLKEVVDDLVKVVTAPQGAVTFTEITGGVPAYGQTDPEPGWYQPKDL